MKRLLSIILAFCFFMSLWASDTVLQRKNCCDCGFGSLSTPQDSATIEKFQKVWEKAAGEVHH